MRLGKQHVILDGIKYEVCDNGSDIWLENKNETTFTRVLLNGKTELIDECKEISSFSDDEDYIDYLGQVRVGAFIHRNIQNFKTIHE